MKSSKKSEENNKDKSSNQWNLKQVNNEKTPRKINETQNWFFEKIDKIYKPLGKLKDKISLKIPQLWK